MATRHGKHRKSARDASRKRPRLHVEPSGAQRRPLEHKVRKITHHVIANCSLHNLRPPLTGIPVHAGSGNPNMAGQDLLSDAVACSPAVQVASIVGEALDQGMDSTALAVQSSAPAAADDAKSSVTNQVFLPTIAVCSFALRVAAAVGTGP